MNTLDRERYIENINKIIKEYLNTPEEERSLTQLGHKYGIKRQTIAKYLRSYGHEVTNYRNKPRINEHIFDVIDTEEKAYWLGFLYADGNLSITGHRVNLSLAIKDLAHVEKFKRFLHCTNDITLNTKVIGDKTFQLCRIAFRNKNIWEQLCKKGCTPQKTSTLKFPDKNIFANKNLIRHFIRGYCDGDGTLGLYATKYNKHETSIRFAGTQQFLEGIRDYLGSYGTIRNESCPSKQSKIYTLNYGCLKARQVARVLYENSNIYLDRKFNIYKSFCRAEEGSSVLKSSKIGETWDGNPEVISEITKGSETL